MRAARRRLVSRRQHLAPRHHQPRRQRLAVDRLAADTACVVGEVAQLQPAVALGRVLDELAIEQRVVNELCLLLALLAAREVHRRQLAHLKVAVHHERALVAQDEQHVAHAVGLLGRVELLLHQRNGPAARRRRFVRGRQVPPLKGHGLRARELLLLLQPHQPDADALQLAQLVARHLGQAVEHERVLGGHGRGRGRGVCVASRRSGLEQ